MRRLAVSLLCVAAVGPASVAAQGQTLGYVLSTEGYAIVFDTADHSVVARVPTGDLPMGIAFTPDGMRAYVANRFTNDVTVIDTADYSVMATIPVGGWPFAVVVSPDGARAYVPCWLSNSVYVIDTTINSVALVIPIPAGGNPANAAITPDGTRLYVTGGNSHEVSVIDTSNATVVDTIWLGEEESGAGVAISPDGSRAYVGTWAAPRPLYVIDTTTLQVVNTVDIAARSVAFSPGGDHAYVATYDGNGGVAIIDTATLSVEDHIPIPVSPGGLAVTPDGHSLYMGSGSTDLIVIDTATSQWSYVLPLGYSAWAVAIAPPRVVTVVLDVLAATIRPSSRQVVPVAVLGSEAFDATTIDPATVRFGRTGVEASPLGWSLGDIDRDGRQDMVFRFLALNADIQCGTRSVVLAAKTLSGRPLTGVDSIKTVGCR